MVLAGNKSELFKRQPHKMVNYTPTILLQIADKLFECVWPFCGVGAWRVNAFVLDVRFNKKKF